MKACTARLNVTIIANFSHSSMKGQNRRCDIETLDFLYLTLDSYVSYQSP
jgi:hypothetical protein